MTLKKKNVFFLAIFFFYTKMKEPWVDLWVSRDNNCKLSDLVLLKFACTSAVSVMGKF